MYIYIYIYIAHTHTHTHTHTLKWSFFSKIHSIMNRHIKQCHRSLLFWDTKLNQLSTKMFYWLNLTNVDIQMESRERWLWALRCASLADTARVPWGFWSRCCRGTAKAAVLGFANKSVSGVRDGHSLIYAFTWTGSVPRLRVGKHTLQILSPPIEAQTLQLSDSEELNVASVNCKRCWGFATSFLCLWGACWGCNKSGQLASREGVCSLKKKKVHRGVEIVGENGSL